MDREEFKRRREARKERYENRAEKARGQADSHHKASRQAVEHIPFGQPILVGHHSERGHRSAIKRAHGHMDKFCEELNKVKHYESKAANVGTGGISSDDPDALDKLRAKLDGMQVSHEHMKKINAAWRKAGKPAPSDGEGWAKVAEWAGVELESLRSVRETLARFPYYNAPFPSYSLTNNNANMKRVKDRIEELEAASEYEDKEQEFEDFTYRECTYENRVMFIFNGKPSEEARRVLKSAGFKWSPKRDGKPWVRQLNNAGLYQAKVVMEKLNETNIY